MKNDEWLIVGAAALFVFFLLRSRSVPAGQVSVGQPLTLFNTAVEGVNKILNAANPGQPGYNWQYFDNGVAISPTGEYYKNGVKVWSP